jgi:hypothetical protein
MKVYININLKHYKHNYADTCARTKPGRFASFYNLCHGMDNSITINIPHQLCFMT